jgi:hypothetical protein
MLPASICYRANLEVDAFHGAERALDNRQALICCDCRLRANLALRHARAHHIEAIELRLSGDRGLIACEGEMQTGAPRQRGSQ